jgi:hypothetical protein
MEFFIEYLANKKAHFYYTLYKNKPSASKKEECLARIKMLDEYVLLLEVIDYLPLDIKRQVDAEYEERLEILVS